MSMSRDETLLIAGTYDTGNYARHEKDGLLAALRLAAADATRSPRISFPANLATEGAQLGSQARKA